MKCENCKKCKYCEYKPSKWHLAEYDGTIKIKQRYPRHYCNKYDNLCTQIKKCNLMEENIMFILKSKQEELDRLKWEASEKNHENMSGKMPYCKHCEYCINNGCKISQKTMEELKICAQSYARLQQNLTKKGK